jgi:broad specificity phosphatase PhoE
MKTVYLVRHGESTENDRSSSIYQGEEALLTKLGESQARLIAERAARLPIDVIVSSPYRRAVQTADVVSKSTGLAVEVSPLFGEHRTPTSFNGREWGDALIASFQAWRRTAYMIGERYEDGENFEMIRDRAVDALKFLRDRPDESIFVVTHGFFCRVIAGLVLLQDAFLPVDLKKLEYTLSTRNTGITVIRLGRNDPSKSADEWYMLTWNDHAHLG